MSLFTTGLFKTTGKQGGIDELREELHRDVAHLEGEIEVNSTDIASNATAISENASAIAQNAEAITQNSTAISQNATAIGQVIDDLHTNYYTKPEVDSKISSVYKYMGSVERYADLPVNLTEAETGHVYNVETADAEHQVNANDNLAWNGHAWDNLGGFVDFSVLATKAELASEIAATKDFATAADAVVLQEAKAFTTSSVADEAQARTAADATKVDHTVNGANGKALIFNESDGGGAKFEHSDGTWSFAGVNDGGASGIAAQIYAVKKNANDKFEGTRIDVSKNAMYYTVGSASAVERMVPANEIATKGDIAAEIATLRAEIEVLKAKLAYAYTDEELQGE